MTEKRFKFNGMTNCIEYDGKSILLDSYGDKIEELLNELYEEAKDNEHYHSEVLRLYKAVSEENEQLKTDNGAFIQDIEVFKEENTHLKLKNEQLQERNDFLRKQLDRVCIDNEIMGDKLKQIGRIL